MEFLHDIFPRIIMGILARFTHWIDIKGPIPHNRFDILESHIRDIGDEIWGIKRNREKGGEFFLAVLIDLSPKAQSPVIDFHVIFKGGIIFEGTLEHGRLSFIGNERSILKCFNTTVNPTVLLARAGEVYGTKVYTQWHALGSFTKT